MSIDKTVQKHISRRLLVDKDTLTAKLLSRELGLSTADAAAALLAFTTSDQGKGSAVTWLLNGIEKEDEDEDKMQVDGTEGASHLSRRLIKLVPDAQLKGMLPRFLTVTKEVYALSPSKAPSELVLLAPYHVLASQVEASAVDKSIPGTEARKRAEPTVKHYGAITHPDGLQRVKGRRPPPAAAAAAPMAKQSSTGGGAAAGSSKAGSSKAAEKDKKPANPFAAAKMKKDEPVRKIGQLGGLFADRNAPAKPEKEKKKSSTNVKKEEPKPAPKKKMQNGAFSDEFDDDDWGDADMEALREIEEAELGTFSKPKQAAAAKKKDKMEVDKKESKGKGKRKRVTKTRTVQKRVQGVNEKGYKVMKLVDTEEEYTTDEASSEEDEKPKKLAKKKSASPEVSKKQPKKEPPVEKKKQSDLASFFSTG